MATEFVRQSIANKKRLEARDEETRRRNFGELREMRGSRPRASSCCVHLMIASEQQVAAMTRKGLNMSTAARIPTVRPFLRNSTAFLMGKDTPRAFLERCLEAYAAWEPEIGAFVHTNLPAAREAADAATARWRGGKPLSAIDGMPIGIKDIIETADIHRNGLAAIRRLAFRLDAASVASLPKPER